MPEGPIIISGRAISVRARGSRRYKQRIPDIAKPFFPQPLSDRNIGLEVYYFYTTGSVVDLDNLLKCVLDGLSDAAYQDDSQVEEIWIRRYNVHEAPRTPTIDPELYEYITLGEPFVSIQISVNESR